MGLTDRYALPYIKYINNKDLLDSTGNYIQHLVKTYNGKKSEKEYTYIVKYIAKPLCYTFETHIIL